jgi:oligopeptide transport system substrate-binding protein
MKKKIAAGVLAAVCWLSGCQFPFQDQESDGSGYLFTYTLTENPDSLDPQIAQNAASFMILRNMMQGLVEQQEDGTITYGVSSHYSVTEDALQYTFTLRDDSFWYYDEDQDDAIDDGETWQVTAQDFVFAFQRMFRSETQSPYTGMFSCLSGAAEILAGSADVEKLGVTAVDDQTLVFTLAHPCADFLSLLAMPAAMPCNEAFFEKTAGRYGLDEESVISNNGFYLRRWFYDPYGSDNLIYLAKNSANDTVQKVFPSNLTFLIRNSQAQAEKEFENGNSDVLATTQAPDAYSDPEQYTVNTWKSATLGLLLNADNPDYVAFQNDQIRQALSMTIPRSAFPEEEGTDVSGAYGIVPPDTRAGTELYSSYLSSPLILNSSVEQALKLYQTGLSYMGMTALPAADILVCENMVSTDDLYEIIQMWQSYFGFYVGIETVSESEYEQRIADGDYVMALYRVTGTWNSAASVLNTFATGNNDFGYSNEAVDDLLEEAIQARDWNTQADLCQQAEQLILQDYLFLPVFYKSQYLIYSTQNQDLAYDPYSGEINFRTAKYYD